MKIRAVTKALIGRGGAYSYIRVLPDEFLLKSTVMTTVWKEIRRAEREYVNIHPPPPINALVTDLMKIGSWKRTFLLIIKLSIWEKLP